MKPIKDDRKKTLVFHYLKVGDPEKNHELKYTANHYPSRKFNNECLYTLRYSKKL